MWSTGRVGREGGEVDAVGRSLQFVLDSGTGQVYTAGNGWAAVTRLPLEGERKQTFVPQEMATQCRPASRVTGRVQMV